MVHGCTGVQLEDLAATKVGHEFGGYASFPFFFGRRVCFDMIFTNLPLRRIMISLGKKKEKLALFIDSESC